MSNSKDYLVRTCPALFAAISLALMTSSCSDSDSGDSDDYFDYKGFMLIKPLSEHANLH